MHIRAWHCTCCKNNISGIHLKKLVITWRFREKRFSPSKDVNYTYIIFIVLQKQSLDIVLKKFDDTKAATDVVVPKAPEIVKVAAADVVVPKVSVDVHLKSQKLD